jgi:hypothetical protein
MMNQIKNENEVEVETYTFHGGYIVRIRKAGSGKYGDPIFHTFCFSKFGMNIYIKRRIKKLEKYGIDYRGRSSIKYYELGESNG